MLGNGNYAGDERLINKVEWIKINDRDYIASREAPWEPAVLCTVGVTSTTDYHLTCDGDWIGPTAAAGHISEAVAWCMTALPHEGPFAWDNEVTMNNLRLLQEQGAEGEDVNREGFLSEEQSERLRFQHRFVKVRES